MSENGDILETITALVEEERALRSSGARAGDAEPRARRLAGIEVELDRCWDLLRQREALGRVGLDPRQARLRPAEQVENYLG